MAKYIFSSKYKKIEREPLYYNIQVSVDKDFSTYDSRDPGFIIEIYKDTPIVMEYLEKSIINYGFPQWGSTVRGCGICRGVEPTWNGKLHFYINGNNIFIVCSDYYNSVFPDVIQVVYEETTFTFTPIPVYEEVKYNLEVSFDRDLCTYDTDGHIKEFEANAPIILIYTGLDSWTYDNYLSFELKEDSFSFNGIDSNGNIETYVSGNYGSNVLSYPFQFNYTAIDSGITFTFKLIPVY